MRGEDQQAYDRGTTIFSPDGRLYQVEYAREAVTQGAPVVGVRGADAVALAAHVPRESPLVEARSIEKLWVVDDRIGVASAGHAADARRLVDVARRTAQAERLRYGEPASVDALSTALADHVQERTQTGGARPYGTALLLGGHDGEPRLIETDPSGTLREWRADAVGRGASEIVARLEERHDPGMSTEEALDLAVEGLAATVDDLAADAVDAATISTDGYEPVPDDRVAEALAAGER